MLKTFWHITDLNRNLVLSIIFGVITTVLFYSGYGAGDHIEQLPIVMRSLNSNYLLNDFFTNASTTSVARLWYSHFLAILAGSEQNLPTVFLILTLGSNIAISVITYICANNLFKSSLAGIWASALAMSISTFELGWLSSMYGDTLIPSTIAIPLIFGSIYFLMQGQIVTALLLSGVSSIFHPLFGLEIGGLLFATYIIFHFVRKHKLNLNVIFAFLLFVPFVLISFVPQITQQRIDSDEYIHIVAYFRHPHHYMPSTFGSFEYLYAVAFLIVLIVLYCKWLGTSQNPFGLIPKIIICLVLLLCIGGYVFVELIPNRIWVTAQTFRLLYIVKWLGVIFVAGEIANSQSSTQTLYSSGVFTPLSLGVAVLSQSFRKWFEHQGLHRIAQILDPAAVVLVVIFLITRSTISSLSIVCFGLYAFLILTFGVLSNRYYLITSSCIMLAAGMFVFYPGRLPYLDQIDLMSRIKQNLSFEIKSELGIDGSDVAEFARENTPEQSVFLTPPQFGQFRLLANRAIVVDFKAFPFSDKGIKEWYERIITCYGIPFSTGFGMINELDRNYRSLDDDTLVFLQESYKFSYAVLYRNTLTNFDVIFQNNTYKVIHLEKH